MSRSGRGQALLKALSQPTRRPGQPQEEPVVMIIIVIIIYNDSF